MQDYVICNSYKEFCDYWADWVASREIAALDFEGYTIVRLAQVYDGDQCVVFDFGDKDNNWFDMVADVFDNGQAWLVFYSGHEKREFAKHGGVYPTCWDIGHLRRALEGGGHLSLQRLVKLELNIDMSKEQQTSDWDHGDLTDEQYDYAALDAFLTWDAWEKMRERATPGHMRAFDMFDSMTDAVIEMEETGMLLDVRHHKKLIDQWQRLFDDREDKLREMVTEDEVWNFNSGTQWSDFFSRILPDEVIAMWPKTEKTGKLSTANRDLIEMAGAFGDNPLSATLRLMAERSTLEKYLSSFGQSLIDKAARSHDGRIRARFNIGAAITGRFSSSNPNLQQIPRDRDFFGERLSIRQGFIAEPGNLLVSYDYSGIEMVVMALVSGDEQLLQDVLYGDVHSEAASMIAGRKVDPKASVEDKELRQAGKPINFGIIYGTTALGLAGRQGWSFEFADNVIQQWAARYPVAYGLRSKMQSEARQTGYLNMIDGGSIYVGKKVGLTKCANYPVQRGALSVMARAITRHGNSMEELRDRYPNDFLKMCSTIHDALIDETTAELAPLVRSTMKADMLAAYREVFPQLRDAPDDVLLEGGMGPNWGKLE